jgi:hypothetical protein
MSDNTDVMRSMRYMAWERAKGELRSIMATQEMKYDNWEKMEKTIDKFVEEVEDWELWY